VTYSVEIPESTVGRIRLPVSKIAPRLRTELAVALYAQGMLSFGKASELAGISRYAFAEFIGQRNIPRHFDDDDLALDFIYARGQ